MFPFSQTTKQSSSTSDLIKALSNTGPGPGAYDLPQSFNKSPNQSVFLPHHSSVRSKSQAGLAKKSSEDLRGPGYYDLTLPDKATNSGVLLKSNTRRMQSLKSETNNLDFYNVDPALFPSKKKGGLTENMSSFIEPVKPSLQKVRINDYSMIRKLLEIKPGQKDKPNLWGSQDNPGPGNYDSAKSFEWLSKYKPQNRLGQPSFAPRKESSLFHTSKNTVSPDPGSYNLPSTFSSEKLKVYSSWAFSSGHASPARPQKLADGFAPLTDSLQPVHISFNKNKNKKWL